MSELNAYLSDDHLAMIAGQGEFFAVTARVGGPAAQPTDRYSAGATPPGKG